MASMTHDKQMTFVNKTLRYPNDTEVLDANGNPEVTSGTVFSVLFCFNKTSMISKRHSLKVWFYLSKKMEKPSKNDHFSTFVYSLYFLSKLDILVLEKQMFRKTKC